MIPKPAPTTAMNLKHLSLVTLLAATVASAKAQQLEFLPDGSPPASSGESFKYTLLKPEDKTSETVKEGEHNPFGKSEVEVRAQNQKGTNEENQIRERLEKLRVVGVSPGKRGLRVMLGDMVLEPGLYVPQVLPEQDLMLRVGNITAQSIELVWVEKKPTGLPTRSMTIMVDLRPFVRCKLMGQPTEKNQWEKQTAGPKDVPVAVTFPDVALTPLNTSIQVADGSGIPRAVAVEDEEQPSSSAPPTEPVSLPVPPKPEVKPNPQWEKAMNLLDKILPKEEPKS